MDDYNINELLVDTFLELFEMNPDITPDTLVEVANAAITAAEQKSSETAEEANYWTTGEIDLDIAADIADSASIEPWMIEHLIMLYICKGANLSTINVDKLTSSVHDFVAGISLESFTAEEKKCHCVEEQSKTTEEIHKDIKDFLDLLMRLPQTIDTARYRLVKS